MNELSVKKVEIDYDRPINNRAKLDTGKLCNYKCEFCYYKDHLTERDSLTEIYKRIDYLLDYGIKEIDLSGGESSIEPNWFNILKYCQNKFDRISCLSHGGKFSDEEFIRKSYDLGLREILFSLHCTDEQTHDKIVGKKGAFKNLLKAIENSHKLNIEVRINTTIYRENFDKIDTSFIRSLNPSQVNFIALNYWRDNHDFESIDYDKVGTHVSNYIEHLKDFMEVNARYFPYCFMPSKERFIKNQYHHIYDMKDWNKPVYNEQLDTSIKYTNRQKVDQSFEEAERLRLYSCVKSKECLQCKYFYVCDGIEKQLDDKVKLNPIFGEKIKIVW
jgi:MoaA/NifB/PqqE/SkfB family radical SAM enzyme